MLLKVAHFEIRYLARNPLLWSAIAAATALFVIGSSVEGFDLGSEGGLLKNAAYASLRNYVMLSVIAMFVTTSFVANAVLRDDETRYGPIIRATGITKREYVLGRFLGAFAIAALSIAVLPLAVLLGSAMPWANPAQIGPHRITDHLFGLFVIAIPNLFIHGSILFALATVTRSMMATYLGVVGFVGGFLTLQSGFGGNLAVAIGEPFAGRALSDAVRYWTVAERNQLLPDVAGPLLYNRLLWIAVAATCLAVTCVFYRFADAGAAPRGLRRFKRSAIVEREESPRPVAAEIPSARTDGAGAGHLLWMRTRFEAWQVLRSPALAVVMAWGLFTTFYALTNRDPVGRPNYPTTLSLIPEISSAFEVVLLVIAIFYAGELVWRERDERVDGLVDASPMPNWGYVVPKALAMLVVLFAVLFANVLAAIGIQLSAGYTELELGKYLLWYVLPTAWDLMLVASLAVLVQALSPHKAVGWAVMVLFIAWKMADPAIDHTLLVYGKSPSMPLSDINGAGSFWIGAWTVRLYWGAFAAILLILAHLLWRRGTESGLRPRLALARRRLGGATGRVTAFALTLFAGSGAVAFYNTNILNEYRSPLGELLHSAEFERRYWQYIDLPQPTIADVQLDVSLYPAERRAETRGRYLLRNLSAEPIREIHARLLQDGLALLAAEIDGATLTRDDRFDYHIFRLATPMLPGEERTLRFETRRWQRGFPSGTPNTRLIENGSFLNSHDIAPVIGMSRNGTIEDATARRKLGLPERGGRAPLEDLSATRYANHGDGWASSDITVSTSSDQTPLAPGRRVSDEVRDGRRVARFVSEAPIRQFFSVQSARYAERHRMHDGVDLAVYYHPAHSWNVDRMLDALAASLDYFQEAFGPYPFDHVRIVEFPGYANFAQAFAGTVPYSETYGFIADFRDPNSLDHVTGTTAHELAHQYWAHQVRAAEMQGAEVLSETLANYSAMMMITKLRGEDQIRRHLQLTLDIYLAWRGTAAGKEPPLYRTDGQNWIAYQKGSLAMYLIQKRLGEDAVNRALRRLLERYRFQNAPYPRSTDLVEALRAEAASDEDQALITDLFERVVLYDLRAGVPSAVQRADGRWDVTLPVTARKVAVVDGIETEEPLDEHIEVGLFSALPGLTAFDSSHVLLMERHPIRSGEQVLRLVTDRKPAFAGVDPYVFYIDRNSRDNIAAVK